MSNETETNEETASVAAASSISAPEKRRATVPEVLKHQKSFEKRYSHIIHTQILETSINMEALQRQLNAFLPLSRSSSLTNDSTTKIKECPSTDTTDESLESESRDTVVKDAEQTSGANEEQRKVLESKETLDISDKSDITAETAKEGIVIK